MNDDPQGVTDKRHHLESMLMRESMLDREVQRSTESPVVRMLPDTHVIKVGGRSILDRGRAVTYPVVEQIATCLQSHRLIIGVGGGVRSRHVYSIGIDLGMPVGVLAELAQADALGNAHILGAWVESVVDFGHAKQIFKQADVFPSIIVARQPSEAPKPLSGNTLPMRPSARGAKPL